MMTICPLALTMGCEKCPVFKLCPAKSIIGNYENPAEGEDQNNEEESKD